jgi:hypothetical protein
LHGFEVLGSEVQRFGVPGSGFWVPRFWVQRFRVPGSGFRGSGVKVDEIVKSVRSVIPGLTRNPELIEITGFPLSRE